MARKREGTAWQDKRDNRWWIRYPLPDGTQSKPVKLGPEITTRPRAKEIALSYMQKAAAEGRTRDPVATGETIAAYSKRWLEAREVAGIGTWRNDRGRLTKWILPELGPLALKAITTAEIEAFVERLDGKVRAGALDWQTAAHVWSNVKVIFDDAKASKVAALRARQDNPCAGVRGPDTGAQKSKAWLHPDEFMALVSCELVPLAWRRLYALSCYTYTRAGEALALDVGAVDFAAMRVEIDKSLDDKTGEIGPTKTGESRRVPVEPALAPLLRVMVAEAKTRHGALIAAGDLEGAARDGGRLSTLDGHNAAAYLQRHLAVAGLKRPALTTTTPTHKRLTFHDAGRATGCTWMAIRGDNPMVIQRRAGHADFNTTQLYIREAETLGRSAGEPFPELPASLLGGGPQSSTESSAPPVVAHLAPPVAGSARAVPLQSPAEYPQRAAVGGMRRPP